MRHCATDASSWLSSSGKPARRAIQIVETVHPEGRTPVLGHEGAIGAYGRAPGHRPRSTATAQTAPASGRAIISRASAGFCMPTPMPAITRSIGHPAMRLTLCPSARPGCASEKGLRGEPAARSRSRWAEAEAEAEAEEAGRKPLAAPLSLAAARAGRVCGGKGTEHGTARQDRRHRCRKRRKQGAIPALGLGHPIVMTTTLRCARVLPDGGRYA